MGHIVRLALAAAAVGLWLHDAGAQTAPASAQATSQQPSFSPGPKRAAISPAMSLRIRSLTLLAGKDSRSAKSFAKKEQ